jgi:hypothetical protein
VRQLFAVPARRGGRHPPGAPTVAVGPSGRLPCDARAGVAPRNSLRSLRSLCSNNRGESEDEARAARAPTPALHFSPPHKSPPPGAAHRAAPLVVFDEALGGGGKAVGGCASAATDAAPSSAGLVAARVSAQRVLTRRDCLSETTAGSEASFSAGHEIEQRREPGPSGRAAAFERRRIPTRGFARSYMCRGRSK